ncbi:MAG: hypothetical protein Kow0077_26630 [Anaerolineae bacterium]
MRVLIVVAVVLALAVTGCAGRAVIGAPVQAGEGPDAPGAEVVARGETLFRAGVEGAPPCSGCHQTREGGYGFSLGPNLAGVASRAAERVAGLSAAAYLEESILHPKNYVVGGFQVSMFAEYAAFLTPQEVEALVAYLLTL